MADDFKTIIIGAFIISLFAFIVIMIPLKLGDTYGKDVSDLESGKLNLTGINNTLNDVSDTSDEWKDIFSEQRPSVVTGALAVKGMFDLFINMFGVVMTPITLFTQLAKNVFGLPDVVINVIVMIGIVAIVFAVWSLLKIGN